MGIGEETYNTPHTVCRHFFSPQALSQISQKNYLLKVNISKVEGNILNINKNFTMTKNFS